MKNLKAESLCAAVAKALESDGWRYSPGDDDGKRPQLVHTNGGRVTCCYNEYERRVSWSCRWPVLPGSGQSYGCARDWMPWQERKEWTNEVHTGLDRDPAATARDIKRRLLDRYLPAYHKAADLFIKREAENARAQAVLTELTGRAGIGDNGRRFESERSAFMGNGMRVQVHTSDGESVSLKIETHGIPLEIARKVLAILRSVETGQEAEAKAEAEVNA